MPEDTENQEDITTQVPETSPNERPESDPNLVDYQTEGLDDSKIEKR